MLLVVDVGNTNTVLGLYRGKILTHHWRLTSGSHTCDELGLALLNLLGTAGIATTEVAGAVVSSVVPPMDLALGERSGFYLELRPCSSLRLWTWGSRFFSGLRLKLERMPGQCCCGG